MSWPSDGGPSAIELFTMASLTLVDASGQHAGRGQLAGCRVTMEAGLLVLVDPQLTEEQHAGMDVADRLLMWISGSHAATEVLKPLPAYGGPSAVFTVAVAQTLFHDGYVVGQEDFGLESGQLQSALQLRCGSHGLSCSSGEKAHSVCVSRIV